MREKYNTERGGDERIANPPGLHHRLRFLGVDCFCGDEAANMREVRIDGN
jgi:hypothetical protein